MESSVPISVPLTLVQLSAKGSWRRHGYGSEVHPTGLQRLWARKVGQQMSPLTEPGVLPLLSTKDLFSPGIGLAGAVVVVNTASSIAAALRPAARVLRSRAHSKPVLQLELEKVAIRPGGPARAGAAAGEIRMMADFGSVQIQ
ncbi:hypothetical protein BC832DRAFT_540190 [Gaertneriomyces semiglobifer]|nr:hypothetical protein BC832DRAFT_540190 [Gaertneriomyces semiglobifer]